MPIKGSDRHLPRSLTLTPEGTFYIHLPHYLGSGVYKVLKMGREIKLMAELKVHSDLDEALQEEALARKLGNVLFKLDKVPEGKLSDLGRAHPIPTDEDTPYETDLFQLSFLIGMIGDPLWKHFPNNQKLQELQQTMQAILEDFEKKFPSAYDLTNKLEAIPLDPDASSWDTTSS